jgi:hypothetical protein
LPSLKKILMPTRKTTLPEPQQHLMRLMNKKILCPKIPELNLSINKI